MNLLILIAAILALCWPGSAIAQESSGSDDSGDIIDRKFVLGIGVGLERFDTNIKLTNRNSGASTFVDAEGSFGLPESNTVPFIYGAYRLNEKHGFGFYAFRIDRTGSLFNINKDFGDLVVDGDVSFSDKTSFSYLSYHYRIFDDKRVKIRGLLGIYAMDLSMELKASGEITLDGEPVLSGQFTETISEYAPLPMVGLEFWSLIEDKWAVGAKVTTIGGSYSDISALVVDASIRVRYQMTEHASLITGLTYLSADVEINQESIIKDIRYGYDGIFLGFDFNF